MKKGPVARALSTEQRLALRLVLLAAHILLAGILLTGTPVLLAGLAALLALLLAGLLPGLGLILPLLLLAGLTLFARLARLAALVIRHTQSPPGWFFQPNSMNPVLASSFREKRP